MTAPKVAHWPAVLPHSLDYPEVGAGQILAGSASRYGERTAFHYAGQEMTYAQLWRQACRFANALHAVDVRRGDVVAVHMPNCPQYPVAYYGILLAGATFSPANPLLPPDDLAFQLRDCGAVAVVTFGGAARAVAAVREATAVRLVIVTDDEQAADPTVRTDTSLLGAAGADFETFCAGGSDDVPAPELDVHDDLAHLAYTGGTTGGWGTGWGTLARHSGVNVPQ